MLQGLPGRGDLRVVVAFLQGSEKRTIGVWRSASWHTKPCCQGCPPRKILALVSSPQRLMGHSLCSCGNQTAVQVTVSVPESGTGSYVETETSRWPAG